MSTLLGRIHRAQRGVTLVELLVALAVFAMFVLMIDAVFSSARTSSRKTELAADVQQNARVATDRILRELHETNINQVLVNNATPGASQIVFKSARCCGGPAGEIQDNSIFCLYTRANAGLGYDSRCFTFSGGNITAPNPGYTSPEPIAPNGTYTPIWQRSVSYCVTGTAGAYNLQRVVGDLSQPGDALTQPACGGDTVATMIESFDVSVSGGVVSVTLKAKGTEVVQGRAIPAQEVLLPGQSLTRN
ncbi:MAG: prepilin-type N-terminal cleavage/methylation domain-containing protein [Bacillati bacterium ANGP1]|uniref:Prepilin-type N-terminal cleavage/methylation domain-containing protein n=1 Tax=Candidatus Segetimicrobium genomatis TaxID=2569760 RepID=A0A537IUJ4_9BACT|nr:MAG: prepilin-type N-terminal cleavage/methylation domain-containing protein [Terrabacteria group bacterium ANGP1]